MRGRNGWGRDISGQRFLIPWIPADRANLGFLFGLLLFSFSLRHIAVVAMVPEQLLAFVGDVRGESRNPIQDGEDREIFFRTGVILIARRAGIVLKRAEL